MKFNCGETEEERINKLSQWHPYFALLPRRVESHDCRWLEWIERRGIRYWGNRDGQPKGWWFEWEYRAKEEIVDEGGWIDWKGGDMPVDRNQLVEIEFANGFITKTMPGLWNWNLDDEKHKIMVYRIVKQH